MSIQHVGALEIENYKNSITQVTARKILVQIEKIPSEIKMIVEGCKMTLKELCVTDTYLDTIISKNISNN